MPKVTFSSENKASTNNDYPRLKLAQNERALIVCIETEPTKEYVHTLRAPEIGPDGRVIKKERDDGKGEEVVNEFFGQHLCFGNFDVLEEKKLDPENCPTCAAARDEAGIDPPKPRYALHVLQYSTNPGEFTVREPFAVNLVAWVFAQDRMNLLIDMAAEWDNLQAHDLKLGPCTNAGFQKYEIQVAKEAQWLANDERKKLAAETFKHNQAEDLSALIARKVDRAKALEDIARVIDRMQQAYPSASKRNDIPDLNSVGTSASSELSSLLDPAAPAEEPAKPSTNKQSLEEIMANL